MHERNFIFSISFCLLLFSSLLFSKQQILSTRIDLEHADETTNTIVRTSELSQSHNDFDRYSFGTSGFWISVAAATSLVLFAGLMSGLTVGYLSIDNLVLELKMNNGTIKEKEQAEKIHTILKNPHLLLVTLLLANAAAMETLPIILNFIVSEHISILISISAVLIFGEVLPQAICTGPNQISIAYLMAPIMRILTILLGFAAFPIGKALDSLLGEHQSNRFLNTELKQLIELHSIQAFQKGEHCEHDEKEYGLKPPQTKLMQGAIDLSLIKVKEKMIPYEKVMKISFDEELTNELLSKMIKSGYSRFPTYRGQNEDDVIGIFLIKKLIGTDYSKVTKIRDLQIPLRKPIILHPSTSLADLLVEFEKGKSHMAIITEGNETLSKKIELSMSKSVLDIDDDPQKNQNKIIPKIEGIVTCEDLIETILKT